MIMTIELIREQYSNLNDMLGSVITISTATQKEIGNMRKDLSEFKSDIKKDLKIIAENVSLKSRYDHENTCPARNGMPKIIAKTSENTGIIKTIVRKAYNSIPPTYNNGNKKIANWIKITTGATALVTAIVVLLTVIF